MKTKTSSNGKAPPVNRMPKDEVPPNAPDRPLVIADPRRRELRVTVVGVTPLVVHRQGSKMFKQMAKGQNIAGIDFQKKAPREPIADFLDTIYRTNPADELIACEKDGTPLDPKTFVPTDETLQPVWARFKKEPNSGFCFPAHAFRDAMARAVYSARIAAMTDMRCWVQIPRVMFTIESPELPQMRFDFAKNQTVKDLRWRAQFHEWSIRVSMRYSELWTSAETLVNALKMAGDIGIGEMRGEKKVGTFGFFTISRDNVEIVNL